jgi:hypothetical protein
LNFDILTFDILDFDKKALHRDCQLHLHTNQFSDFFLNVTAAFQFEAHVLILPFVKRPIKILTLPAIPTGTGKTMTTLETLLSPRQTKLA